MFVERRAHPRQKTYLGASIDFNTGHAKLNGLIRNASRSGIRMSVSPTADLPRETYLHIKKTNQRLPVRLIWRNDDACGFAFAVAPGNVVSLPSAPFGNSLQMWDDQTGGALLEYALLAAMSVIIATYEVRTAGAKLSGVFQTISAALH